MIDSPAILVIEDGYGDLELFEEALRPKYRMFCVTRVKDALPILPIADLIIMDMKLPDGTGMDILDYMEREHLWTPVIAVSAFHCYQDQVKNRVMYWLDKPFAQSQLLKYVEEGLSASRAIRAIEEHDTHLGHWLENFK